MASAAPLITDHNFRRYIAAYQRRLRPRRPTATIPCLPRRTMFGHHPSAKPFWRAFPTIPRTAWKDMIAAGLGSFLSDIARPTVKTKDQNSYSLCWAYGTTTSLEVLRAYNGQPPIELAPESLAYQITGGIDRGGTTDEALEGLTVKGVASRQHWQAWSLTPPPGDQSWETDRTRFRVPAWLDINSWEEQITAALLRIPVAIGLRWWSHLVCQLDPVILPDGTVGILFQNSWGDSWGDHGYGLLTESRGTADIGAFAPHTALWPKP